MIQKVFDHKKLADLEKIYGDCFYLYNLYEFKANYNVFLEALKKYYSNSYIAYSYKTNYTPKLCQLVNKWNGYAEVVSHMEYLLALKVGVAPENIIFNGPYKTYGEMREVLTSGAIVNLDWPYQVSYVIQIAKENPRSTLRIGIRITFTVGEEPTSRFGFEADSNEIHLIFKKLKKIHNIKLTCLHCHFLTSTRSTQDYQRIAKKMISLSNEHFKDNPPEIIDVGGGFFSKMKPELQEQFGLIPPSFEDYAKVIGVEFENSFSNRAIQPKLVIEPGISITANIAHFCTKVIDVRLLAGRKLALVSGSFYDIKPTGNNRNLPIKIIPCLQKGKSVTGKIDIVGFTCMEHDVLYIGYDGTVSVGDYILFESVGAYTNVLRPPFIRGSAPILAWKEETDKISELKRADEMEDVFRTYKF